MLPEIGISEYSGKRNEMVGKLDNRGLNVELLDPEEHHPRRIRDLDFYHTARVREGAVKDFKTASEYGIPTVHDEGWLGLWNQRYDFSSSLEEIGLNVPEFELWKSENDIENSDLDNSVILQLNDHFGPRRHEKEIVPDIADLGKMPDIMQENEDKDVFAAEYVEHETLYKAYKIGNNFRVIGYENGRGTCDQREAEEIDIEREDWLEEIVGTAYEGLGEEILGLDVIEGEEERFVVDLNMVCSTRRIEDGAESYADLLSSEIEDSLGIDAFEEGSRAETD